MSSSRKVVLYLPSPLLSLFVDFFHCHTPHFYVIQAINDNLSISFINFMANTRLFVADKLCIRIGKYVDIKNIYISLLENNHNF